MKASERIHGELVAQGLGLDDDEMRERIIAALDEVVSKLEKDVAGTERARSAYARNYSEAVAENDRLRGELEALRKASSKASRSNRQERQELEELRVEVETLRAVNTQLEHRLEVFGDAPTRLELLRGLEQRDGELTAANDLIAELKANCKRLKEDIKGLRYQESRAKRRLDGAIAERDRILEALRAHPLGRGFLSALGFAAKEEA